MNEKVNVIKPPRAYGQDISLSHNKASWIFIRFKKNIEQKIMWHISVYEWAYVID